MGIVKKINVFFSNERNCLGFQVLILKNLEVTLKNMKNTCKFTREILEFCQSEKVGTVQME